MTVKGNKLFDGTVYSRVIADLMFAYINKDEDIPHQFELEAFREGLAVLERIADVDPELIKRYQELLHRMERKIRRPGVGD